MSIENLSARFDEYDASVTDIAGRLDKIETKMNRPGAAGVSGARGNLAAERKAVAAFARSGDESRLKSFQNSMSVGDDSAGGYMDLPAWSASMTTKLWNQSPMRRLARVETVTSGSEWKEIVDFGQSQAVWVSEKQSRPATDTPPIAMLTVPIDEQYALQPITQRALDDVGGFDLGAWIEGKIVDKFSRSEGTAFINGSGVGQPRGLLNYPVSTATDATRPWGTLRTIPSGAATSITADALRNMVWAVRGPYRAGSVWLANSGTMSALDTLKDGDGNYLLRPGMTAGTPPSMLGFEIAVDEDIPDVAASSLSLAFGNLKLGYVLVERQGYRLLRDPFSDKPNVGFYAYRRIGGGVANSEAVVLMKTGVS